MNTAAYQTSDKNELSEKIFPYLVKHGLENITIREMCKHTGIVQGTLYYWFKDKTGIVCEAAQYGLKTVTDEIFEYVFASLNDLKGFFANCLDEISKYKKELRFIYQLAASPVYGEKIRKTGKDFNFIYDKYTHRLSPFVLLQSKLFIKKERTRNYQLLYSCLRQRLTISCLRLTVCLRLRRIVKLYF